MPAEGSRVGQYQSRKPLGNLPSNPHPDAAAPVVSDQGHLLQVETLDERAEIRDMRRQSIAEGIRPRLVRKATTNVIHRQTAVFAGQLPNEVAPREAPGRIAVHEQQWLSAPFVQIVVPVPTKFKKSGLERVLGSNRRALWHGFSSDRAAVTRQSWPRGEFSRDCRGWLRPHNR